MSLETKLQFDGQFIAKLSQDLREPAWMLEHRLAAFQKINELPLPKLEKTNLSKWNFDRFIPYTEASPLQNLSELPEEVQALLFDEKNVLVQKNSSVVYKQLQDELQAKGVIFTDLHTASSNHEDLVKQTFMTLVTKDAHRLAAQHGALATGGIFLYVPRNVEVEIPFQGLFYAEGEQVAIFPHVVIVAEENSRVEFVANFASKGEVALSNAVIEVIAKQNAKVRLATINHMGTSTVDVLYRRANIGRDAEVEYIIADLSEGRVISDSTSHLNESGGIANVKSVALGSGDMRANITSSAYHWGTHTASDVNARAVMKDNASSITNSITKIEKGASKADGQQSSKVLMLSDQSRGDSNPILLIDENDVTAGHAASVGRVDENQLYYLMSRGISRVEAERLVVRGFLDAVVSEIPSDSLRKTIHQLIERKLR
ncbi:Fe-S cluster assembly protein SufD [Thermoactinomyces sp. DSM 45891]|uniref:Fe-S cluster assembly protein SufD n=1 Tax=Thermoactinomyces sp. DSM 45891 TaxID=1761907 RepID=UPI0009194DC5|nr:Fe-S cluster assembly protein SufD [Thermoactinomyces sp. DSM 45891]SFX41303.1 Fe-S cluster assembly protein SufD [Thermoactinomyces sp. DSM 45891]